MEEEKAYADAFIKMQNVINKVILNDKDNKSYDMEKYYFKTLKNTKKAKKISNLEVLIVIRNAFEEKNLFLQSEILKSPFTKYQKLIKQVDDIIDNFELTKDAADKALEQQAEINQLILYDRPNKINDNIKKYYLNSLINIKKIYDVYYKYKSYNRINRAKSYQYIKAYKKEYKNNLNVLKIINAALIKKRDNLLSQHDSIILSQAKDDTNISNVSKEIVKYQKYVEYSDKLLTDFKASKSLNIDNIIGFIFLIMCIWILYNKIIHGL